MDPPAKTDDIKEEEFGLHNSLEANIKVGSFFFFNLCLASSVANRQWLFFKL